MPRHAVLSTLCALALLIGACENAGGEPEPPDETVTAEATPVPSPPEDGDEDEDGDAPRGDGGADEREPDEEPGTSAIGTPSTDPVETDDFPGGSGGTAFLTDVRVGAQEGFDRVVLEFDGDDRPSYRVRYVEPPVAEAGTGNEVEVAGSAYLEVILEPASGVDISATEPRQTYEGPRRVSSDRTQVVREVVRTGDFEANLSWVIGVDGEAPFAAAFLSGPSRLVIDVQH